MAESATEPALFELLVQQRPIEGQSLRWDEVESLSLPHYLREKLMSLPSELHDWPNDVLRNS